MPYSINIKDELGQLTVTWQDINRFVDIAQPQIHRSKNFLTMFLSEQQDKWTGRSQFDFYRLPINSTVIDIGCGIATMDLLLSQRNPTSTFYLIDGNEPKLDYENDRDPFPTLHKNHWWDKSGNYFYNSWDVVHDAIRSTNLNPNNFNMIAPDDDNWPMADLITSYHSWCFHYPVEIYLNRVINALKPGGKLFVTIRTSPTIPDNTDNEIIEIISNKLGSKPTMVVPCYRELPFNVFETNEVKVPPYIWYKDCLWVKPI